jgi:hypothetical protein
MLSILIIKVSLSIFGHLPNMFLLYALASVFSGGTGSHDAFAPQDRWFIHLVP